LKGKVQKQSASKVKSLKLTGKTILEKTQGDLVKAGFIDSAAKEVLEAVKDYIRKSGRRSALILP